MASVMDGSAPLTRAAGSGGVAGQVMSFQDQKFGPKVRIAGFGGRRPRFFEDEIEMYFLSVSRPLDSLSTDFKAYFKFMQDEKKAEKKEKKGGIFKTLHSFAPHFFDFKVWKKITGQARKPEIAALQQIRDILIEVHKLDKDMWGRDPQDMFMAVFDQFKYYKEKFAPDSGAIRGIYETVKGFTKETLKEGREENLRWMAKRHNEVWAKVKDKELEKLMKDEKTTAKDLEKYFSDVNIMTEATGGHGAGGGPGGGGTVLSNTKDIADKLEEQILIDKEKDNKNQPNRQQGGKEQKKKSFLDKLLGDLMLFGGLAALLGFFFGKKGVIAAAAGVFFLKTLPRLLWMGLKGLFSMAFTSVGSLIKFFMQKGFLGSLKFLGKAGAVGAGAGIFASLTAHDVLKEGGARDQWKAGNKGGAIATGALGSSVKDKGALGVAGNITKQTIKWAALGTVIAPGLGTAIGAGVGLMGSSIKALWEKGIIEKWIQDIKKNKVGATIGGLLGSVIPGAGTILGLILGAKYFSVKQFSKLAYKIGSFAEKAFSGLLNNIMEIGSWIGPIIGDIGGGITDFFKAFWENIKKPFLFIFDMEKGIGKLISNLFNNLASPSELWKNLKTKMSDLKDSLLKFIENVADWVKGLPSRIWEAAKNKGKQIKADIQGGIEEAQSEEFAKALSKAEKDMSKQSLSETFKNAVDNFKKATGIDLKLSEDQKKEADNAIDGEEALRIALLTAQNAMLKGINFVGKTLVEKKMSITQETKSPKDTQINQESNPKKR